MGIVIQGDGKKERDGFPSRYCKSLKEDDQPFFPTIHSSVYTHSHTFLPCLPSSNLSLIVLGDGVWGENKMYKPTNHSLLQPKSLGMPLNLRLYCGSFSKESSMG